MTLSQYSYLITFVVCWAAASTSQANLVLNGDFESNLDNWQWFGDGLSNVVSVSTDTPSGSGFSADIDVTEVLGLPWLVQDVPVTVGDMLTFSATVREARQFIPPGTNPSFPDGYDAWIAAQVWMLPSSESGAILAYEFTTFTDPAWETKSFDITVPEGATIARVLFNAQDPDFGVGTGRYLIDDVKLELANPGELVGDYNQNGTVDAADYTVWQDTLGSTTNLNADGDNSNQIDAPDYDLWKSNFGTTSLPGIGSMTSTIAVPEPGTLGLASVFICFLLTRRFSIHGVRQPFQRV